MAQLSGNDIGLYGLAVMGQNLALNIADKGFSISVCNRSPEKVDTTVERAHKEQVKGKLVGYKDVKEFVASIRTPRAIIILVTAGKPVEDVIDLLLDLMEPGDMIIDGGNEWYEYTERRAERVAEKKILYMGMGVSGGEEGARHGPSLMPGGPIEGYKRVEDILMKVAAKTKEGTVCVTHIGPGGAGNYVKMVHNGIEYGDMQLIAEAYDLLKNVGGLSNSQLADVFAEWNKSELESFLIEITSTIFRKKDDRGKNKEAYLVDQVLDMTGQKGTGRWTVRDAAEQGIAAPTMSAALDVRNISALYEERQVASQVYPTQKPQKLTNAKQFVNDVRCALYASKICSYTQGMNLMRTVGEQNKWELDLGKIASIWKAGCIIRAVFLDRITAAYTKNPKLVSLLIDPDFAKEICDREAAWRRVVQTAVANGIPCPAISASLAYFDTYRRSRLPANLTQAQRDYFGAHMYDRIDYAAEGKAVHSEWSKLS